MLAQKTLAQKFSQVPLVRQIMDSKVANELNTSLKPHLSNVFIVLGWILVVLAVLGILWLLPSIGLMVSTSGLYAFPFLLSLAGMIVQASIGYGLIQMKRFVPTLATVSFGLSVLYILSSAVYSPYMLGWAIFSSALTFVLLILILKNETMFVNS